MLSTISLRSSWSESELSDLLLLEGDGDEEGEGGGGGGLAFGDFCLGTTFGVGGASASALAEQASKTAPGQLAD